MAALIATAGTLAGAASSALPVIGVALSAASAFSQIQAGRAQAVSLARQSTIEQVQARGEALQYRQAAVDRLKSLNAQQGALVARAGAGGLDPFSGSYKQLSEIAEREAAIDYRILQDNQIIAREGGSLRSGLLLDSAAQAKRSGIFGAGATLGQAALTYRKIGGPPKETANG